MKDANLKEIGEVVELRRWAVARVPRSPADDAADAGRRILAFFAEHPGRRGRQGG